MKQLTLTWRQQTMDNARLLLCQSERKEKNIVRDDATIMVGIAIANRLWTLALYDFTFTIKDQTYPSSDNFIIKLNLHLYSNVLSSSFNKFICMKWIKKLFFFFFNLNRRVTSYTYFRFIHPNLFIFRKSSKIKLVVAFIVIISLF